MSSWTTGNQKRRLFDLVVARDGLRCAHCSRELTKYGSGTVAPLPPDCATLDHIIPRGAKLGIRKGDISNIVLSCPACNFQRGAVANQIVQQAKTYKTPKTDLRAILERRLAVGKR